MKHSRSIFTAAFLSVWTLQALALQVTSLTPQGETSQVRQATAKFSDTAITFGDPKAPSPYNITCTDAKAGKGTPRWNNDKEWVYQFDNDLPPGVTCTLVPRADFKSPKGTALPATTYKFNTGGPFVQRLRPSTYERIDEDQYFMAQLSGAATAPSFLANTWCAVEGLGEKVPVRFIEGKERAEYLKSMGLEKSAAADPQRYVTFACNRRLSPSAKVQVVYGKGVSTPSGIANSVEKRFNFQVREPFAAEFSCERENAQAACLPIRPLSLTFNAPVSRQLAAQIRLSSARDTYKPDLGKDEAGADDVVSRVEFKMLLPEQAQFTMELPKDFKDASGRTLRNADNFPLKVATAAMPPLAKFAAAPFGIAERFAEENGVAMLPVTLRNVEAALRAGTLAPGKVSDLQPKTDAEIINWFRKVQRFDGWQVPRALAQAEVKQPLPKPLDKDGQDWVQGRMVSLLAGQANVKTVDLPKPVNNDPRPFEVVGIPLAPGFHVVEIASQVLGKSLLDARHGAQRTMYVRTSVLATNLGVHFKLGRENALAWVTTLDKGKPVAGATVRVSSCDGRQLATGTTNAQGIADLKGLAAQAPPCPGKDEYRNAYFVSARATAGGVEDLAFTWSDWSRGIERWRFNVPTSDVSVPDERVHTVFDRTLLRAGETVSMKHYARTETSKGFGLPDKPPATLEIVHTGTGQKFSQPLAWRKTPGGGLNADSVFAIPPAAKLGQYTVTLIGAAGQGQGSGNFRVEEFRLPVLEGRISPTDKRPLVDAQSVPLDLQVNYVSGGGAANLPVRVSALVRPHWLNFSDYEGFSFSAPRERKTGAQEEETASQDQRVIADKIPLTLDRNGAGKLTLTDVPAGRQPRELLVEASYADPNGEIQTLRNVATLWPAAVVAGIKTEGWVSAKQQVRFQALALGVDGKPAAGVSLSVKASSRITTTSRKRMVGGFYTYDNRNETKDLGELCSGKSDSRGLLLCEAKLGEPGEVELAVTATDAQGHSIQAASSVWVTRQGELWFGGEDHDRIDVLPEKKTYQAGETAQFQVRMPFRFATALVAVEREGVIETQVVQLNGDDPTVRLKVKDSWGPNVYVSVLALRGRLREVPWYSFFTWGFKAPREWWTAFWFEGREYVAPTALVDLSKPAFRLGLAEIRVGTQAHELAVSVKADKESYTVRGKAMVTVSVKLPDGKPAANAEVALAAVDQALLELIPNDSWNLLSAMLQRRSWGVETSTAQMEIIGRRHYGRKAAPPGGGGGKSPTRELLDTLLLWNPRVVLDANGQAQVTVPLNDALTTFKIVAIADAGTGMFGTGQASIRATQDLQIISGLPPLVREEDKYRAQLTLRNTTAKPMKVAVTPRATLLTLKPQTIDIPAGEAREVAWEVSAPAQLAFTRQEAILWEIEARDTIGGARDSVKARQRIVPAVPVTVQQATLVQLDGPLSLPVAPPADALPGRGGVKLNLQPRLADGLPGVRDWFANYPFICLEQKASKAMGLRDEKLWQSVAAQIPTYLDGDGLAGYFPPRDGDANRGSDALTAYLLAAAHEASGLNPAFALPDEVRAQMERGLSAFIEGRIQRDFWSPRRDLDVRKITAIEALSRYGQAQPKMMGSIVIAPDKWPTHAVIDWLNILRRVQGMPQREQRLAEATQVLKSRLSYQGTRLVFSTEQDDYWWWLMANGDVNTARLILAVIDDPAWKDDMGRLASGFINRQKNGAWLTTTANLWGGMALEKFSARYESTPVTGMTRANVTGVSRSVDWRRFDRNKPETQGVALPWGKQMGKDTLAVTHQGTGKPWLTVQSLAAVDLKAPFNAGFAITKTITAVEQAVAGKYSRGDVLRVTLEVNAASDMTWVVVSDPIPGGATLLGSGLGRDSQIATTRERRAGNAWPAFEERSFEAFRSYYEYVAEGVTKIEYTVRLNNAGEFALPPTRAEAMYAPEMFGESPNARVKVEMK